jgi:predicted P-loop ATPase
MTDVLREAKRLHDIGFAIHWLRPRSKMPVEGGWTKGPRKTWAQLKESYVEGYNVGVRLGDASKIKGRYLAVIDCDVKSKDPKHEKEMNEKLAGLVSDAALNWDAPIVLSGRGNGSQHLYVVTERPGQSKRLAQSSEDVRVKMPSAGTPSVKDKRLLTDKEIADGYRMRAAWEISFMGTGSQVVLPPSIHPDSGKEYTWKREFSAEHVPVYLVKDTVEQPKAAVNSEAFKLTPVDINTDGRLPAAMIELIETGKDCDDRSAGLFKAAISLVRHGYTDNEILTVLTEKDTFLGACAYEHAKTGDRTRAALWVKKYTLDKARTEYDVASDFDKIVSEEDLTPKLSREDAVKQMEAITHKDFKLLIDRTSKADGAKPLGTLKNVVTILAGCFGADLFKLNEFSGFQLYGKETPWGAKDGEEIKDSHIALITHWFATHWRLEPKADKINNAITIIAERNRFHPVREYLDELAWDGKPRLDTWLKRHLSASGPKEYLQVLSRKVLIAMVARIYDPGIKFEHVLILEGTQGIGKSRAVRALASDEWFSDSPMDLLNKDSILTMQATWVMELGELAGLRKADVNALKDFVSRQVDRIRVPYGKRMENFPRQCIFIGTTNNGEYLQDTTGNRRFWPVPVAECFIDNLIAERDQLFAEAKFAYELGEKLWTKDKTFNDQAVAEQEARVETDAWSELLTQFFDTNPSGFEEKFLISWLFELPGAPFVGRQMDRINQYRVGTCLRKMGYKKKAARDAKHGLHKYWFRPEESVGF